MLRISTPSDKLSPEEVDENMEYFARVNMIKNFSKNTHTGQKHEPGILDWISKNPCDLLAVKNIKQRGFSPLFRSKLSKEYFSEMHVSTLIYND